MAQNDNKKFKESSAARRARLMEEERQQQEKLKKKKIIRIVIISVIIAVIIGCSVGIPLGIKAYNNSYRPLELKNLCNSEGNVLSDNVLKLKDKKVVVTAYMLECTSMSRFLAGSQNAQCPFATQKYVTNVIPAVYEDGSYFSASIRTDRPYKIYGTLHIGDTTIAKGEVAGMVIYVDKYELA